MWTDPWLKKKKKKKKEKRSRGKIRRILPYYPRMREKASYTCVLNAFHSQCNLPIVHDAAAGIKYTGFRPQQWPLIKVAQGEHD